ncbi:acyl-CoA desaturase, partial [Psychrobacter sp. 1Y4]
MRLLPPMFSARSALPTTPIQSVVDKRWVAQTRYPTLSSAPLSKVQTETMAAELDALYQSVMASLGAEDARYIQRIYAAVVYSEILARGLLAVAACPSSRRKQLSIWLLGTSLLSFSKILNNMELGHNVMHGQYDWMQ